MSYVNASFDTLAGHYYESIHTDSYELANSIQSITLDFSGYDIGSDDDLGDISSPSLLSQI